MADPQPFLDTLSKILDSSPRLREQIKFQCIGLKSPDSMAKLSVFKYQENLQLIEHLPKQYGCQVMQSVDLLLILNPPTIHRYIQGKLYEYIASGTPVLVFGRGGEMADIVSSLDAGIIVDDKVENELAHVLNNFNSQIRPRNSAKIDQWLKSRQRNVLALSMFEHLDKLIKSYKN
jgi:glycosyltransferase involved in cell wall biosynthesis